MSTTFTKKPLVTNKLNNSTDLTQLSQTEQEFGQLSLDVYENDKEIILIAPIAGVKLDDINLSITEDILTISGSRNLEDLIKDGDYIIQECFWGSFSRSIVLPDHVDTNKIAATFKKSILKITIPKAPGKNKQKLIKIKTE